LIKNGISLSGKQQYRCRGCSRTSLDRPQAKGHSEEFKAQVLAMYFERPSMRGIERATGVSRQTLAVWLKKDEQMRQETPQYLEATLLPAQNDDVLELDELWSYVGSKKKAVWLWIALCRRTRQVVAWHFGSRGASTCRAQSGSISSHRRTGTTANAVAGASLHTTNKGRF
jgi:insertion element IS1 protein InsB